MRREPHLGFDDILAVLADVNETSYLDTGLSLETSYVYRVTNVNTAGLDAESLEHTIRPLNSPPVEIRSLEFDPHRASAEPTSETCNKNKCQNLEWLHGTRPRPARRLPDYPANPVATLGS